MHRRRFVRHAAAFAALSPGLLAQARAQAPAAAYVLKGTEVIATPAPDLGRDYEIYVSLPQGHASGTRRYPVLYVTDADYAFPLIRAIADRIDRHGVGLRDFILVGLSYAKGESGKDSRNRDYTPVHIGPVTASAGASRPPAYGQASAYLRFLRNEVFPRVEQTYRADPGQRIYAGHSYGALLGLEALLSQPTLFTHYILGSPSLWFGNHAAFDAERRYAATHTELPAKVRFYIGAYEQARPGHARYNTSRDMVLDLKRFVAQMQARRYKGLDLQSTVLQDEDHATAFPQVITRGLMWALGESGAKGAAGAGTG